MMFDSMFRDFQQILNQPEPVVAVDNSQNYTLQTYLSNNALHIDLKTYNYKQDTVCIYQKQITCLQICELIPSIYDNLTDLYQNCFKNKNYTIEQGSIHIKYQLLRNNKPINKSHLIKLQQMPINTQNQLRQIIHKLKQQNNHHFHNNNNNKKQITNNNNNNQYKQQLQLLKKQNNALKTYIKKLQEKIQEMGQIDYQFGYKFKQQFYQCCYGGENNGYGRNCGIVEVNTSVSSCGGKGDRFDGIMMVYYAWCQAKNIVFVGKSTDRHTDISDNMANIYTFSEQLQILNYFPENTTTVLKLSQMKFSANQSQLKIMGLSDSKQVIYDNCKEDDVIWVKIDRLVDTFTIRRNNEQCISGALCDRMCDSIQSQISIVVLDYKKKFVNCSMKISIQ